MKSYFTNYKTAKLLPIAISCLLFSSMLNASGKKDNSKSYNAIMMCTLPQEMLKDSTLKAMDITYMNPETEGKDASLSFKKSLNTLKKEKHSSSLHKNIINLSSSWQKTKKSIDTKVSQESVNSIYDMVVSFDKSCLVIAEKLANKKYSMTKNKVARLNLYVQQLTTLYIIKAWDSIDEQSYKDGVEKIISSYEKNYELVKKDKKLTAKTKGRLEKINKAFTTFKFMTTSNSGRYMPVLAAKKASNINMLTKIILEGK